MAKAGKIARSTVKSTGESFKKALDVLVPPRILHESSFFGGLNRLGDAMVNMGTESQEARSKSKQYVVRHSGGAVADVTIGFALLGMPVTFVTALFSDGCKVISTVLREAAAEDRDAKEMSRFFGDMSAVSNNFMKLFDIPSKEVADDVHVSIGRLAERLDKEGRMTAALRKDLKELDSMRARRPAGLTEAWFVEVQETLSRIADEGAAESSACRDLPEIKRFIDLPTAAHMVAMRDGLVKSFNRRQMPMTKGTSEFIDGLVDAIEGFSSSQFQDDLRTFMIKNYEMVGKAQDAVEGVASMGYLLIRALLSTTYKGASLFGAHYKKQAISAAGKKKRK